MTSVHTKHEALRDAWLKDDTDPRDLLGEHGLLKPLTKRGVERVLEAALTAHLGSAPPVRHGTAEQHTRPGKGQQTVPTDTGPLALEVPRDRHGSGAPPLVPTRQRRLAGCDDKVVSRYARGLAPRDMQGHLEELDGTAVSPTLIATSPEAGLDEVRTGQARPRASVYPRLDWEAFFVPSRQEGPVQTPAVSLAWGITIDGEKALLGWWRSASEGATWWRSVCTELKNRGVQDGFRACVDGLQGLPEALETVLPHTQVQRGMVHKVRHSLRDVPWRARRAVAADLRALDGATTLTAAAQALERLADRWDPKDPASSPSGLADWERLTVCFDDPPAMRRAISTTNAIASFNYALRKGRKGRRAFPHDESIIKVLDMGLHHIAKKWTQPIPEWKAALNQCVMLFGDRMPV